LFTESATEREMNAVDSEFRKNLSSDDRRLSQIEKSIIARPGSVLNRFSTGNLETLKKQGIRQELLEFHKNNYSANLMSLCLVGNHSIDYLQDLAVANFSGVENKNLQKIDYSNE
jgi:insulysin